MTTTVSCPQCSNKNITARKIHVSPVTGNEMKSSVWVGGGIGLLILVFILSGALTRLMANRAADIAILGVLNAFVVIGGFAAAIAAFARYSRSPAVTELVCRDCAHRWRSGEAARVVESEMALKAGDVHLSYGALPPGTYKQASLGLAKMDTCVYCGAPAAEQLHTGIHKSEPVGENKTREWTFQMEFPFCKEHARISKRNSKLLMVGLIIGAILGVVLVVIWFIGNPKEESDAMIKWLSSFVEYEYQARNLFIVVMVAAIFAFVGSVALAGVFIVKYTAGIFSKTVREQGDLLGVSLRQGSGKEFILSFTRAESAAAYAALNQAALQSLAERAGVEAARVKHEMLPEVEKAAEVAELKIEEAGATCWFCQKNAPADGTPYNIVYFKVEGNNRIERTLWAPRCRSCQDFHRRSKSSSMIFGQVIAWSSIGLFFLIGVVGGGSTSAWLLGVVVAVAGMVGAAVLLRKNRVKRAVAAGIKMVQAADTGFEGAKDLLAEKWTLDVQKTGKAGR